MLPASYIAESPLWPVEDFNGDSCESAPFVTTTIKMSTSLIQKMSLDFTCWELIKSHFVPSDEELIVLSNKWISRRPWLLSVMTWIATALYANPSMHPHLAIFEHESFNLMSKLLSCPHLLTIWHSSIYFSGSKSLSALEFFGIMSKISNTWVLSFIWRKSNQSLLL